MVLRALPTRAAVYTRNGTGGAGDGGGGGQTAFELARARDLCGLARRLEALCEELFGAEEDG